MDQIAPFEPGFTLGERVEQLEKTEDNKWIITTSLGSKIKAPVVVIAAGLGSFEPRKPAIPELLSFENKGVDYIIRDPEVYRDKKLVISGGGDSALDWTVYLAELAQSITLVHRRKEFRGAPDTVDKVMDLVEKGRVELITEAEVTALNGNGVLKEVTIVHDRDGNIIREANNFIPLFGLSPKLGPIAEWGLNLDKNEIIVNTFDYQTNVPGIYAVGDINTYPGKLKLILCGFHEATLMCQSAFQYIYPDKKLSFKYTTVMGKDALHL
jgi:thioredoxin reductase (NADPH)